MSLTFDEYQTAASLTAIYPPDNKMYPLLGLVSEAGEVAGKYKKMIRDDGGVLSAERREAIIDELGDVLWYLSACADSLDMCLAEVAARNIDKLSSRQRRNALNGDGDNR